MSEENKCPKCGSGFLRKTPECYHEWNCASFAHASGECFEQSDACETITTLRTSLEKAKEALKEIDDIAKLGICLGTGAGYGKLSVIRIRASAVLKEISKDL